MIFLFKSSGDMVEYFPLKLYPHFFNFLQTAERWISIIFAIWVQLKWYSRKTFTCSMSTLREGWPNIPDLTGCTLYRAMLDEILSLIVTDNLLSQSSNRFIKWLSSWFSFSFLSTEKLFAITALAVFINVNEFLADFTLDTLLASLSLLLFSFTRRNEKFCAQKICQDFHNPF